MRIERINVTTDASGDVTGYSQKVFGVVHQISYVPDGSTPLATGGDIVITGETTTVPILTITNIGVSAVQQSPRRPTVDLINAASLYAAAGEGVEDKIALMGERISLVVANGGDTKSGSFFFAIQE